MQPSLMQKQVLRAIFVLLAGFVSFPVTTDAAPVKNVEVSVCAVREDIPGSVKKRIEASISSIGNNVFIGKEENILRKNSGQYNKVLADIINRVVIGYMVENIEVDYGVHTTVKVSLEPVGEVVETVETTVDYGNLTPEAADYVKKDTETVPALMSDLLTGLPVDSVGWAESVSRSAGKDLVEQILPEFDAKFEIESGKTTKVHIFLIPKGEIVRSGILSYRKTTVPKIFMIRAAMKTEAEVRNLEGLPVHFVDRHRKEIEDRMRENLLSDYFVKKYGINIMTELVPGETTVLKVDALTDHWNIQTKVWLDVGREARSYAFFAKLGHYIGERDLIFGEVCMYPGPMEWNVYSGFSHKFGDGVETGYKYDFADHDNHVFAVVPINDRITARYDYNFSDRENEIGLSYKVHNYITAEYVYNSEEGNWLRLIANL